MSKNFKHALIAGAALAAAAALPGMASAQSNGVTSCDAPGGRQQAGALIGAVVGGLAGSQISSNERGLGAVAGAAAGAAAGSYIGCNQQRGRAAQAGSGYGAAATGNYVTTSNLRVRSGPGTSYSQVGSLGAGASVRATGSQGEWVQLDNGGWVSAHYLRNY